MKLFSRPRFTLRTFAVLFTVLTIWLGVYASQAYKQRRAIGVVTKLGGTVFYDYQLLKAGQQIKLPAGSRKTKNGGTMSWGTATYTITDESSSYLYADIASSRSPVPTWVRDRIGDDMFVKVIAVHLDGTECTDEHMKLLAGLPQLRVLLLHDTNITDRGLAHLSRLKKLERLSLDKTPITGSGLKHLHYLPKLRRLSLIKSEITDAGLQKALAPRNLETVFLDHTTISDAGLMYLRSAHELRTVSLNHTMVTGTGFQLLESAQIETLKLSYTPINDACLPDLAEWPKLRILSLAHSSLSDSGLEHLKRLESLQELHLPWVAHRTTDISVKAAREIERALPNTKIIYPP